MTVSISKQREMVVEAIGQLVSVSTDELKFEHKYGGRCWHTENKDDFYCFLMCVTHEHTTEWVVFSDDPSQCEKVDYYFSVRFSVY